MIALEVRFARLRRLKCIADAPLEKYLIHDVVALLKRFVSSLPESLFGGEALFSSWIFVGSASFKLMLTYCPQTFMKRLRG